MSKKDGGSAFPSPGVLMGSIQQGTYEGMTLRDYFACGAMNALVSNAEWQRQYKMDSAQDFVASVSYVIADAMLKERDKKYEVEEGEA